MPIYAKQLLPVLQYVDGDTEILIEVPEGDSDERTIDSVVVKLSDDGDIYEVKLVG